MRPIGTSKRPPSNEQLTELRTATFKAISAMKGRVIMDTHASVVKKRRFIPGLPFYVLDLLKGIKAFVHPQRHGRGHHNEEAEGQVGTREIQHKAEIDDQRTINISTLVLRFVLKYSIIHNRKQGRAAP